MVVFNSNFDSKENVGIPTTSFHISFRHQKSLSPKFLVGLHIFILTSTPLTESDSKFNKNFIKRNQKTKRLNKGNV